MINRHAKGQRGEAQVKAIQEKDGWKVERKNWSRFAPLDFWNVFDLFAIRKGKVLATQVKINQARKAEVVKKFRLIAPDIPKSWRCELWVKRDRGKWKVFNLCTLLKEYDQKP